MVNFTPFELVHKNMLWKQRNNIMKGKIITKEKKSQNSNDLLSLFAF